ncbi:thiamine biosynthesis protein ThiF [Pedobacter ginsengisoli]|uniref:Molybdopterin-synthase adenylyltransferase n=1 Tax=Pedobacter ginsengisoli TaxID=363852 RepID=A0A2D1U2X3_9SPHI|nr:HesA/MoeB/ThiF family protein [Pedobacter ginsengisoli]ATP55961.1 thiamine biosynthesis protein ThiF [Pedobacter ginsengisoli]
MDSAEMKRYNRQILLPEVGIEGQQKLKAAKVLVIGAGGLGCPVLLYLAAAGVGKIGVIDHDTVDESNLHRQILFNTTDVGKSKADTSVNKLQLLNPHIDFVSYPFKITLNNANSIVQDYDLVVDGSDNFPTRYLVNDTCVALNKPLVFGSIFKFEGQVSVFNYNGGTDYRSLFPEPPPADKVPNCDEGGVIGSLPGIIGSYMANETIKLICGFGELLSGKLLMVNVLDNSSLILNIGKNVDVAAPVNLSEKKYEVIDLETFEQLKISDPSLFLIDVREDFEFEEYNIGGYNFPLYELNDHWNSIPEDKKIVLCCTSGLRSKIAYNLLKAKTDTQIYILSLNK